VDEFPEGYPRLAAFKSSEPCFSIYRGFSYLHSRVLLQMQDELRSLEDNLISLDKTDFDNGDCKRLKSRICDLTQAKRENVQSKRVQLLSKIKDKLEQYGTELLVIQFSHLQLIAFYLRRHFSG